MILVSTEHDCFAIFHKTSGSYLGIFRCLLYFCVVVSLVWFRILECTQGYLRTSRVRAVTLSVRDLVNLLDS